MFFYMDIQGNLQLASMTRNRQKAKNQKGLAEAKPLKYMVSRERFECSTN